LCEYLCEASTLPVSEPDDKELLLSGHVYLAPRDYHLLVENRSFALSTDPPLGFARPSIDMLFESAAEEYNENAIGVILTGANRDGARGLATIKARGGLAIVEDPVSAFSPEMPEAAIALTQADWILPLQAIAACLQGLSEPDSPRVPAGREAREATIHGR
jgi:two-component system chemotaxis response regulator CheB